MKSKFTKLLLPLLALAVVLTACAGQSAAQTAAQTQSDTQTSTAAVVELSQTTVSTDTADSDVFSNRDLSGEYDDAEAVSIVLTGDGASTDSDAVSISGSTVTITQAGTYVLTGSLDDGSVVVNASKDDKIQLVLDGVTIHSETFAAIYVAQADKVFITLADGSENVLSNGGSFTQIDDSNVDAVIFSRDDLTFNGSGSLTITSPGGHGIVGKDELVFTGGVYEIGAAQHAIRANDAINIADGTYTLAAYGDGLHAENSDDETLGNIYIAGGTFQIGSADDAIHANTLLQIDGGSFEISAAEGLEATYIRINGGEISIEASDDGINAAYKSSAYTPTVEINGGTITIVMGSGDTDGVDSNGNIVINGGTIDVTGSSTFDCDGSAELNGGTVICNGQQVDSLPNQMMGGMGSGMNGMNGMNGQMGGRGFHN